VESAPGAGTTFQILLPFSKQEEPVKAKSTEAAVRTVSSGTEGKTILVVEDDDIVRDLVREILKQKGHNILTARNGGDALQLARQYEGKIDLLITDMVMRRIDGIMLSKKMQSFLPDIKVMLMSGYGNDVVKEEELSDITFLQKPFLPNELVQKVGTIFSCAG
jgi:two-component system, cell cycle sensor histidine kinase and response regulator CckA